MKNVFYNKCVIGLNVAHPFSVLSKEVEIIVPLLNYTSVLLNLVYKKLKADKQKSPE